MFFVCFVHQYVNRQHPNISSYKAVDEQNIWWENKDIEVINKYVVLLP